MRNLVINCNLSVKDSFDEEKVKDAFMSLFIVTVNSDIKINGFRINDIDDSVLEQIPPLPKEHLGWEAPDRSEILAIDKDFVLMKQETLHTGKRACRTSCLASLPSVPKDRSQPKTSTQRSWPTSSRILLLQPIIRK